MSEIYNIPVKYKEGVFALKDFENINENVIELCYEEYGDIVTYKLPECECGNTIRMYEISQDILETTLRVTYDKKQRLKMITINEDNKDVLVYIHYEDMEQTKKEIKNFAIQNADFIIEKIGMCKDKVSRLFVEYFNDGEYMDFHAKLGTEEEKVVLEQKYPQYKDITNSCGDYDSEILDGDNDKLKIMVSCADNDEMNYFQFAVDIMIERIREKALDVIDKAEDFAFMCMEYD